jgi:hypothetical protein
MGAMSLLDSSHIFQYGLAISIACRSEEEGGL